MTVDARATLKEYMDAAQEVIAESVDMCGRLVIMFRDVRGWHGPVALRADGSGTDPISPVVPLVLEDVHPEDQDVLYGILEDGS